MGQSHGVVLNVYRYVLISTRVHIVQSHRTNYWLQGSFGTCSRSRRPTSCVSIASVKRLGIANPLAGSIKQKTGCEGLLHYFDHTHAVTEVWSTQSLNCLNSPQLKRTDLCKYGWNWFSLKQVFHSASFWTCVLEKPWMIHADAVFNICSIIASNFYIWYEYYTDLFAHKGKLLGNPRYPKYLGSSRHQRIEIYIFKSEGVWK